MVSVDPPPLPRLLGLCPRSHELPVVQPTLVLPPQLASVPSLMPYLCEPPKAICAQPPTPCTDGAHTWHQGLLMLFHLDVSATPTHSSLSQHHSLWKEDPGLEGDGPGLSPGQRAGNHHVGSFKQNRSPPPCRSKIHMDRECLESI
jgi:hypothetical protein